jgi:hypothetical protein
MGVGDIERLTLTAADLERRIRPWKVRIDLAGLADRVRQVARSTV